MKVGIAADHGGYEMKQKITKLWTSAICNMTGTMTIATLLSRLLAPSQTESWNEVSWSVAVA